MGLSRPDQLATPVENDSTTDGYLMRNLDPPDQRGVVFVACKLAGANRAGKTLAHEIGHMLGLYHVDFEARLMTGVVTGREIFDHATLLTKRFGSREREMAWREYQFLHGVE